MNWVGAIDVNRAALVRIVAMLVALLEAQGGAPLIAVSAHRAMVRILRPAESAVRRLIVIMARKVVVMPESKPAAQSRKWPAGLVIARTGDRQRQASFRLFDPIRHFVEFPESAPQARHGAEPRIRVIDFDPRVPEFLRAGSVAKNVKPGASRDFIRIQSISNRLAAVTFALSDLPRQARRLMRILKRQNPEKRRLILRPGPPPGNRKRPKDEVHHVLKECHALARYALSENSS